jgi:hypothetical protein
MDPYDAGSSRFWCEKEGLSLPVPWGVSRLVVDTEGKRYLGYELLHFIHGEHVFALVKHSTSDRKPARTWCAPVGGNDG